MSDDKQKDENQDPKPEDSVTDSTGTQAAAGSDGGSETPKGYVTEASYKGIQRAAEKQKIKLEQELAALRAQLEGVATELEEAKMLAEEKTKLEKAQTELNTSVAALQAERDKLTRKLTHQSIILSEFPSIASLAAYIPDAETEEAFRANATQFSQALATYLKSAVNLDFAGSTPPIDGGNSSASSEQTDELWEKVYALAGVPGKEEEYRETYAKLQDLLKPKQ